jgi:methionine-gamma-lyase
VPGIANRHQTSENPQVIVAADNTYMAPMAAPADHGADLSIYSATKYIGGHSDVIAGAICGSSALIKRLKVLRTFLGNMCGLWTGWLLLRSLETLVVRMERQTHNAQRVAAFYKPTQGGKGVLSAYYRSRWSQYEIYKRHVCRRAMISFDIKGAAEALLSESPSGKDGSKPRKHRITGRASCFDDRRSGS